VYPRLFPILNLGQTIQRRLGKSLDKNEEETEAHEYTTCSGISGAKHVLNMTSVRKFQYYVRAYAFRSSVAGQERCLQNDTYRDILCNSMKFYEITRGLRLASCLREHIQNAVRWSDVRDYVKTGGPATCLSVRRLRRHCQQV
jgi:hypothetical protein